MKYEFSRSPIAAVLTSSKDCQVLMQSIKKETEGMMEELNKVKTEFLAQEKRSKRNNLKTLRKGKDVYIKVEDVESLIVKILNESGLNLESVGMPTLSDVRIAPFPDVKKWINALQGHK